MMSYIWLSCLQPYLPENAFAAMWVGCFMHVKIREFKAFTGKCTTCALSRLRRQCNSKREKEHIRNMHMLHRTMYMGERLKYYEKRH